MKKRSPPRRTPRSGSRRVRTRSRTSPPGPRRLKPLPRRRASKMAEIPVSLVKELRDETGAGMMECKRVLVETDGDIEEARRLLRERGMVSAAKRADLVSKIGENVVVVGASQLSNENGDTIEAYVHRPAEKIGVMVRVHGGSPELARMLAQHISFASPEFTRRDDVPAETVAEERAVYEKLPDVISKPEDVRPRIVEGMLAKRFFAESVLVDQPWIHDTSLTVGKALTESGAEVREFVRYALTR